MGLKKENTGKANNSKLSPADKIKITTFIRNHSGDDIYINDLLASANKYRELDVVEYLVDFVNTRLDEKSKEQISYNYLEKLINVINALFFYLVKEKKEKIPNSLLDSLLNRTMNIKNNFLKKSYSQESDSIIEKILDTIVEELQEQKKDIEDIPAPTEPDNVDERITELSNIIKDKDKQIKELGSSLQQASKENDKVAKKLKEKTSALESTKKELKELNETLSSLKNELKTTQAKCSDLENDKKYVIELQNEIERLNKTIRKLEKEITTLEDTEKQAAIARKEEAERRQKELEQRKKSMERIKDYIFKLLCEKDLTIEEIKSQLAKANITLSNDEIKEYLKKIQERINIINQIRTIPIKYGVCSPKCESNLRACINIEEHCYNVLLVSDMHLKNMDTDILYWLEKLYEYADKNNIYLIINLGDFIDVRTPRGKNVENICKIEALLEEVALKFPKSSKINHALLGGNHDNVTFPLGIDPIKKICDMREDFLYLGHNIGTVYLNKSLIFNQDKASNYMVVHHPNFRAEPNILDDHNIEKINAYLNSIYGANGLSRGDQYVDIIGHFHKSSLDIANGICVVPSYFFDRVQNGAWHLKIFFNKENNIDHIVFIPLICTKRLTPTSEISYKKTLKQ